MSCLAFLSLALASFASAAENDALTPWTRGVHIAPVSATPGRHTIHTYYLTSPESPDGKHVLFVASTHPAGYVGDIVMLERKTGTETVLAKSVHTEDAHRAACQQWLSGGRRVAYHEVIKLRWRVVVVDVETGKKTVVAEDRQVGFGRPEGDLLLLYGCHWNPGPHRDLEIWNAATGKIDRPVRIADVEAKYGQWLAKEFRGKPTSVFFPVLSPDGQLLVTDGRSESIGGKPKEWGIMVGAMQSGRWALLHSFDQSRGAASWRRNDPHPAFSADGRRIYYNVSEGRFTRLFVAERS